MIFLEIPMSCAIMKWFWMQHPKCGYHEFDVQPWKVFMVRIPFSVMWAWLTIELKIVVKYFVSELTVMLI